MEEGYLVIDKAKDWTSHDVVAKLRGITGIRKIGHMGTLDPLATGVLVCAIGRGATKTIGEYMGATKDYEVEMELGKRSDTYDSEGQVEQVDFDLNNISEDKLLEVVEQFWGVSLQMPPAFSAKKINGKKAYELARAGKPVELKPKEVEMHGSNVSFNPPVVTFNVTVSSGTYIRSLVHDIGESLGCGAIMTDLRRTRVGDFTLEHAVTIEEAQAGTYDLIPLKS